MLSLAVLVTCKLSGEDIPFRPLFCFNYQGFIPGIIPDLPEVSIRPDSFSRIKTLVHGCKRTLPYSLDFPRPARAPAGQNH
jgi:hypothetical protein